MTHLLDTSVCSQPIKVRPLGAALERWQKIGLAAATSAVCLAEIEWGLFKNPSARRWEGYHRDILPSVQCLVPDRETWTCFARMKARQFQLGLPVADFDLLIAATAVHHNLILATLNTRHFATVEGLRWEDWSV